MNKIPKIKYLFWHPRLGDLPKYLAFVGLLYSAVSPFGLIAGAQVTVSQKPAILALDQLSWPLAESQPALSLANQTEEDINPFTLVNGVAIVGQNNPSTSEGKTGQENGGSKTKNTVYSSIISDSQNIIESKKGVIITAYSSTPDQTDASPFITAMGSTVRDGIVACNFLPFGTKIRLPEIYGDKVFVVEDRMALRNSHKMDVWMESRAEALQFGVKRLTLEILE